MNSPKSKIKNYLSVSLYIYISAFSFATDSKQITINLPGLPTDATSLEMIRIEPDENAGISKPFYMGKYEITQAQWDAVFGKDPDSHRSKFRTNKNLPVEKVSWIECQMFLKTLNSKEKGYFRLPTEAEWEYACLAGSTGEYSFSDSLSAATTKSDSVMIMNQYMWWKGNNQKFTTKPVGQKKLNAWGLHDMHGNVAEWCANASKRPDDNSEEAHNISKRGWFSMLIYLMKNGINRASRNGGFFSNAEQCKASARGFEQAFDYHYSIGFRVVREMSE